MFIVDLDQPPAGFTGCLPRPAIVGANPRFPVYGTVDDMPIIPRSEWKECSLRHKVWEIINQAQQNSCAAASTRGAMQLLREYLGMTRVQLSHGSLYGQANGGSDVGANVMSILEAMMDVGIAPASLIDPYDWTSRDYPANWKQEAAKYRILEAWDCPTFEAMCSAVQRPFPVVFGVYWGRGGHAIVATGLVKSGGNWIVEFLNSHGYDYGEQGFGHLTESQCSGIRSFGAFAIRSVTIPSDEVLPPAPR